MSSTIASTSTPSASSLITSTGIGSGLDISGIVSALTTAFGAAQTTQLGAQQSRLVSQVSAYGTFTSALDSLQSSLAALETPTKLAAFGAAVADKTIASATTASNAVAGQYSLLVSQLATAATLTSKPVAATAAVGTGTLTLTVGGASSAINIDSSNNTLAGIASAINNAPDNPGVTANVITTTDGSRLVLKGTSTGAANAITVTSSGGDGGLSSLVYDPANGITNLTNTPAQDAKFSINGFPASSSNNLVSGAITGVTINLLQASALATPTTLTVSPDTTTATAAVDKFVTALNATISSIQTLTAYDPSTQTAGPLNGNATLESFQNQLASILGTVKAGGATGIHSLADLGITANTDGSYASDDTKLGNALTSSLAGVAGLLGGSNGIATQLDKLVSSYTGAGGLLSSINQGLQSSLKSVASQQAALATQLASYSATLTAQYNAMDTAVAQLKLTQQYLTAEFNASAAGGSSSGSSNLSSGTVST
jgi:flagellar hook-associated protein 2